MSEVKLVFDDTIICLAGDGYGRRVCREQVIGKVDLKKPFILEFPERIKIVSTHFVSGMINEMLENLDINIDIIRKNITVKGNNHFVETFYWTINKEESKHSYEN